jgi:hypothetical protein
MRNWVAHFLQQLSKEEQLLFLKEFRIMAGVSRNTAVNVCLNAHKITDIKVGYLVHLRDILGIWLQKTFKSDDLIDGNENFVDSINYYLLPDEAKSEVQKP